MGTFEVLIGVSHLHHDNTVEVQALVDTGATDTVMPASLLDELGIERKQTVTYSLGDGSEVVYDTGPAMITYGQYNWPCPVAFGDEGVYVVGATTLEIFKLIVDPVRQTLIPTPPRRARQF